LPDLIAERRDRLADLRQERLLGHHHGDVGDTELMFDLFCRGTVEYGERHRAQMRCGVVDEVTLDGVRQEHTDGVAVPDSVRREASRDHADLVRKLRPRVTL
jgi:hypothetical protein